MTAPQPKHLRLGTRGSRLARVQSEWVCRQLEAAHPGLSAELVIIQTSGDRITHRPLADVGGKGLFVKELDEALLARKIDFAVHSLKDLPGITAPGVALAAVPEREDPRDVVVTRSGGGLGGLAAGSSVGTSSPRRVALVRAARPDLHVVNMRGNVDTRLRKLADGETDALVLARAGLRRLGIDPAHADPIDPDDFVPAIGQGALALTCRADDEIELLLRAIEHRPSRVAVDAEREFLATVGGSCVTPLAAYATTEGDRLTLRGLIAQPDGMRVVRGETSGPAAQAASLGSALARRLLDQGGAQILRDLESG